jgi:hypothetical protein
MIRRVVLAMTLRREVAQVPSARALHDDRQQDVARVGVQKFFAGSISLLADGDTTDVLSLTADKL